MHNDGLLNTKLRLIQSNKELLEKKILEYEKKLGRVRLQENPADKALVCESHREKPLQRLDLSKGVLKE